MNNLTDQQSREPEDALQELFRMASRRPEPPPDDAASIRAAVHADWQQITRRSRRKRNLIGFATAASVLFAAVIMLDAWRPVPPHSAELVARIERQVGEVRIYQFIDDLKTSAATGSGDLLSGYAVSTGNDSALALSWRNGGSIRLDEKTTVKFSTGNTLILDAGRVYFDSQNSGTGIASKSRLVVETKFGDVEHLGTQYMVEQGPKELLVSVREGMVQILADTYSEKALAGEKVQFSDDGLSSRTTINPSDSEWDWAAKIAPHIDAEKRSIYDFIEWVGRETGRSIQYVGPGARNLANEAILGSVDKEPLVALQLHLITTDLAADVRPDTIVISVKPVDD